MGTVGTTIAQVAFLKFTNLNVPLHANTVTISIASKHNSKFISDKLLPIVLVNRDSVHASEKKSDYQQRIFN